MRKVLIILIVLMPVISFPQGSVIDTFFFSNSLSAVRNVDVYLPQDYDPEGSIDYPTVYFLHGGGCDDDDYGLIIAILDSLIESQLIDPVVVVKPDGNIGPYWGSFYTNSELYGDFEDYIAYDLVEFIESSFRVIPEKDKRSIMGHSMGGYGAAKLGLKHPDTYRGFASHSGELDSPYILMLYLNEILDENSPGPPYNYHWNAGPGTNLTFSLSGAFSPNLANPPYYVDFPLDSQGQYVDSVLDRWQYHNPPYLARSLPSNTDLAIYFDCGLQDEYHCYPLNAGFADSLDQLGIAYEFQSFYGDHNNFVHTRLPIGLVFLDSVMSDPLIIADKDPEFPVRISMHDNYPNPFNAATMIKYKLPQQSHVTIDIYDILGRKMSTLVDKQQQAGDHQAIWRADDFSSGMYFYKLQAGDFVETKKMLLLK